LITNSNRKEATMPDEIWLSPEDEEILHRIRDRHASGDLS
jgi:hypothetical protein